MKKTLVTRYQKNPQLQTGYDEWLNVLTGERGTWDEKGKPIRKEAQNDRRTDEGVVGRVSEGGE